MSLLNNEELGALCKAAGVTEEDDGHIVYGLLESFESALLSKLSAGVSVEPVAEILIADDGGFDMGIINPLGFCAPVGHHGLYMASAIAAARVQENERCLSVMDSIGCGWRDAGEMVKFYAANHLREAIHLGANHG